MTENIYMATQDSRVLGRPRWIDPERSQSIDLTLSSTMAQRTLGAHHQKICWRSLDPARIPLRQTLYKAHRILSDRYEEVYVGTSAAPAVTLEAYMYGFSTMDAQPFVVVTCDDQKIRNNIMRILSKAEISIHPCGIGVECYEIGPIFLGGFHKVQRPFGLGNSYIPGHRVAKTGFRSLFDEISEAKSDLTQEISISRAQIVLGSHSTRTGALIYIDGVQFGITVGHVFWDHYSKALPVDMKAGLGTEDGLSATLEFHEPDNQQQLSLQVKICPESGLDYALFTVQKELQHSMKLPDQSILFPWDIFEGNPSNAKIWVDMGEETPVSGQILAGSCFVALPGQRNFQELWTVILDREIESGMSGACVIDVSTNLMYGHLMLARPGSNMGYITLFNRIRDDLVTKIPRSKVEFRAQTCSIPQASPKRRADEMEVLQDCLETSGIEAHRPAKRRSFHIIDEHKCAYRVCGIPISYDVATLQTALARALDIRHVDMRVYSFSSDVRCTDQTKTATVSFSTRPAHMDGELDRWTVDIPEKPGVVELTSVYIDSHFLGFTPLSPTENDALQTVDCIAIHGLGGHALGSFRDPESCFVWLRDAIAVKFPNLRVWVYGYDSNLDTPDSYGDICDYSVTFRRLWKTTRKRAGGLDLTTPSIFVAHSLGGLLLKEAFIGMHNGEDVDKALLKTAYAVLFFGVPSHGMDTCALAAMADKKPQRLTIEMLNQNVGHSLREKQHKAFCDAFQFSDSKFIRFFELVASSTVRQDSQTKKWLRTGDRALLVSQPSAKQGRPWDTSEADTVPIQADHMGIVKFSPGDKVEYPKVEDVLSELAQLAVPVIQLRLNKQAPSNFAEETKRACLRSLSFPNIDARRDDISTAHSGTGDWLFASPQFQQWLNHENLESHNGVFWIKGKAGVGKSTLIKHALEHCESTYSSDRLIASYFFNARGEVLEKTPLGLYRSLVYQIIDSDPMAFERFLLLYSDNTKKQRDRWAWSIGQLQGFLLSEMKGQQLNPQLKKLIIFIDALDECEESEARRVIQFLEKLSSVAVDSGAALSICLSSRHYPTITMKKKLELVVETVPEHGTDIAKYVKDRLTITNDEIEAEVLSKASGVFMWTALVVEFLNKAYDEGDTISALKQKLDTLPDELDLLYQRYFESGEECSVSVLMFQWVLFSVRPLTLEELYFAVQAGTDDGDIKEWDVQEIDARRMELFINKYSKGLVDSRSSPSESTKEKTMQFIHKTVNDFFLENKRLQTLDASLEDNVIGFSHDRLVKFCLRYIMMENKGDITAMSQDNPERKHMDIKYPFRRYAFQNILYHAEKAQSHGVSQHEILKQLDEIWEEFSKVYDEDHGEVLSKIKLSWECVSGQKLLYALSLFDCQSLLELLLRSEPKPDLNAHGAYYGNALQAAATRGNESVARLLVEAGADVNATGGFDGNALQAAATRGSEPVVRLLLEAGADPNIRGGFYGNALQAAAKGDESIVKLLLDAGADVNAQGGYYENALQVAAATRGSEGVVKLLLEAGANVNAPGGRHGNALQAAAATRGNELVVRLLLEAGADVNAQGGSYGNALQAAVVIRETESVIRLLLEAGADVNAQGGYYGNALQAVVRATGNESVVRLLLEAGADVQAQGGRHGSALQAASGNKLITKLLREAGAR